MTMVRSVINKALMAGFVLAIILSAQVSAQESDLSTTAKLVIQVQELQDEVRSLRGQLEQQTRELEALQKRVAELEERYEKQ